MGMLIEERNNKDNIIYTGSLMPAMKKIFVPKKGDLYNDTTLVSNLEVAVYKKNTSLAGLLGNILLGPKFTLQICNARELDGDTLIELLKDLMRHENLDNIDDEYATAKIAEKYHLFRYRGKSFHVPSFRSVGMACYLYVSPEIWNSPLANISRSLTNKLKK